FVQSGGTLIRRTGRVELSERFKFRCDEQLGVIAQERIGGGFDGLLQLGRGFAVAIEQAENTAVPDAGFVERRVELQCTAEKAFRAPQLHRRRLDAERDTIWKSDRADDALHLR